MESKVALRKQPDAPPRVALLIETSREFGRQLLRGIATYSHSRGPWAFLITPGDFRHAVPRMREWGGDAIIARLSDERLAKAVAEANVPTVILGIEDWALRAAPQPSKLCRVEGDSEGVAQLAAEHLFENRLKNFAFVGLRNAGFSEDRQRAFTRCIEEAGHRVLVYEPPKTARDRVWEREHPRLAKWVADLPKPIGVMACNDDRGREVLEACALAGVSVPEDVSVLGVDNDSLLCDLATPPLSSIEFNAEAGGYAAAAALHRMLNGDSAASETILIKPLRVVPRRSTNAIAVDDRDVASALARIRTARGRGVTVEDVVANTALPRRTLEMRFRYETGRSILEEIQHARLAHAKQLLATTSHPVSAVAELAGYSSTSYLSQVFRRAFECTPAAYRKSFRELGPKLD